ncbi:hypothetical protein [Actinomadura montaniterrae]|uniref:Uncharacterized protein n=1 Tax=Actinomadura montaniterrae TaxID=1803903 RepID=A0A6L3VX84_9ACTN|nr:hypothetical protein [Actinomadura montaniterrae]KAB2384741.1 hypothetical protein F9B16_09850 [Actinomadura montaniterrae]
MADIVFNIALGKVAYYAGLPAANDGLVVVPIEATGLETDAVLRDYDNLSVLLAASNNEQTTMGRKALASVTATVDDINDRVNMDAADVTWTAAGGNPVGALIICYDPDVSTGTDADLIPLSKHGWSITPDGSDVTATIADFIRASSAA